MAVAYERGHPAGRQARRPDHSRRIADAGAGYRPGVDAHTEVERQHYNVTLGALVTAGIAFALQQTLVIPALPALREDLDTTTGWATWLLTAFLLSASVLTPLLGKLGDQYGKERLLVISLGIFLLGSIGGIFAWNIGSLIACRVIQGAGGAVFPLSFAIINDEFPAERRGAAIGIVSSVFAVGGSVGLVLSGVIVDYASWRWLFIIGAIGVAAAIVLVHFFVPESPVKTPSRLDIPGAILLSGALISLLVALTEGESWGWTSAPTVGLFATAAVLGVVWALVELRVPEPMVDIRMLGRRPVLFTNFTALIAGFAMFGSFVLIPNFVQAPWDLPEPLARVVDYGFGATATQTGLYLLPGALIGFASGPFAGRIARRFGWKTPLVAGMTTAAAGILLLAIWHEHPWQIVLANLVLGSGLPLTFAAMATLIVTNVRPSETGVATGMNTVMRTIGGVIGGQAGAALLSADTIAGTSIPAESAFVIAFTVSAVAAVIGAIAALFVTPLRRFALARTAAEVE
jgi:EmrB/QacA subfamily drug resistance transporter